MSGYYLRNAAVALLMTAIAMEPSAHGANMKIGDICRLKGQETNSLQGLGVVVGLQGTGDRNSAPTARALARMMQLMGGPMGVDRTGLLDLSDVSDAKNVAMVFVTAEVPAAGAQPGDTLDIQVNAISAKSLLGGTLMLTPLLGPRADNPTVYAMAQGPLKLAGLNSLTSGVVQGGAKMEAAVPAGFQEDGRITLILERDFASFDTAQRIEEEINDFSAHTFGGVSADLGSGERRARAIDQIHVEVAIPRAYQSSPIAFISSILGLPIHLASHSNRVVINESKGFVAIGEDVEIAPVLITHGDIRIETGARGGLLVPIGDQVDESSNAKLKSLADALNALEVPTEDLIEIIKTLKRKGDLFGEVIFQ